MSIKGNQWNFLIVLSTLIEGSLLFGEADVQRLSKITELDKIEAKIESSTRFLDDRRDRLISILKRIESGELPDESSSWTRRFLLDVNGEIAKLGNEIDELRGERYRLLQALGIGDTVCEIHDEPMETVSVPSVGGLPQLSLFDVHQYRQARITGFRHSGEPRGAACMGPFGPSKRLVCASCVQARLEWIKTNRIKEPEESNKPLETTSANAAASQF